MRSLVLLLAVTFVTAEKIDINADGCGFVDTNHQQANHHGGQANHHAAQNHHHGRRANHHGGQNNNQPGQHIVGGEIAGENEYPWMAALFYNDNFRCGGSLVKGNNGKSYILTAAHCTDRTNADWFEIHLGQHDLSTVNPEVQLISVDRVYEHPNYNRRTLDWDIALMELSTNPIATSFVNPGCIPDDDKIPGNKAVVAGWGVLEEGGSVLPDELHKVEKDIKSHDRCEELLRNDYSRSNMLCSGVQGGGKDACQGDSGGPLMDRNGDRKEINGVVSWGFGCGREDLPGVYSNVYMSLGWLDSIINAGNCIVCDVNFPPQS